MRRLQSDRSFAQKLAQDDKSERVPKQEQKLEVRLDGDQCA